MRRLKKNYYLALFCSIVGILGLLRWALGVDAVPVPTHDTELSDTTSTDTYSRDIDTNGITIETDVITNQVEENAIEPQVMEAETQVAQKEEQTRKVETFDANAYARKRPHPIYSVPSYSRCFPDLQDTQIASARRIGVHPVKDRAEAEKRKSELVYIGSNPYYKIDPGMSQSIPYLVPRAAMVLETIARNYMDSLHVKGIPLHKILVSSVLRTEDDIQKLMRINPNASPESCHRYGTTFDIAYNRYHTIAPPNEERRAVRSDTLKWVLAEVLRDVRRNGLCHIKYEVKQGCFHITAR